MSAAPNYPRMFGALAALVPIATRVAIIEELCRYVEKPGAWVEPETVQAWRDLVERLEESIPVSLDPRRAA